MLLRTGKNLKFLYLDEIICNPIILEYFYKNTTVTFIDFHLSYGNSDYFKSMAIEELANILYKNSILTSLTIKSILLGTEGMKLLLEALDKNTAQNSLDFCSNWASTEERNMIAKFLCKNTTLKSLNLSFIDLDQKE
ncbi:hypothetical protein F8M41_004511 [Gigaspora margarita]|uniref:Uncharacterized protein n=1 Tax=Gigaspora margarita TaxID=4874 RepID=A0A8H4ERX9_GIGMA|nr:hypothetical protein F8M41_004511 [Gigaspora margarita]